MSTVKSNAKYPQALKYMVLYFVVVVVVLEPPELFSLKRSTAVPFRVIGRKENIDRRLCVVLELEHLRGEISFKTQNTILVPLRGGLSKNVRQELPSFSYESPPGTSRCLES